MAPFNGNFKVAIPPYSAFFKVVAIICKSAAKKAAKFGNPLESRDFSLILFHLLKGEIS